MRLQRQHDITPEQFDSFRNLLRLKPQPGKARGNASNPFVGMFFDYGAVVSVQSIRDNPVAGWACTVEIAGDNYENKKFEVIAIAVNSQFDSAEAAIEHGKSLIDSFGVECVDVRTEEL